MQSDPDVTQALLPLTQGSARVTYGNLLTLPVTGGLMYVQPIYATRQLSDASYPILRYVTVSYGDRVGIGNTLERAIIDVLGGDTTPPDDGGEDNPPTDDTGNVPTRVRNLLDQAEASFPDADEAFRKARSASGRPSSRRVARRSTSIALEILNERNGERDRRGPPRATSGRPPSDRPSIWVALRRGVTLRSPTRGGAAR